MSSPAADPNRVPLPEHRSHPRTFEEFKFAYPVLSRRSKGISVGLNLNPDKICNFDCIYCQVNRREEAEARFVETERMLFELDALLTKITTGELFESERFRNVPPEFRRLNDIAFSGDGEPTTFRNFDELVAKVAAVKAAHRMDDVKLVLITNASMFHRPVVQRALVILDANQGEIWAKLDAGTAEYFAQIERTSISFQRILDNITDAARLRPLVLQSLFMRVGGEPPTPSEIEAYCDRINEIMAAGGKIRLVQIYTVARPPAESFVSSLNAAEVDAISARVREKCSVPVESYY